MDVRVRNGQNPADVPSSESSAGNPADLPLVTAQDSIRSTMEVIGRFAKGIAMVIDEDRRLLATVTDGDVRRAILAGVNLDHPVSRLQKPGQSHPVVAKIGTSETVLLTLMAQHGVRQVPLIDDARRVCGLAVLHEILRQTELPVTGVIMAGGYG